MTDNVVGESLMEKMALEQRSEGNAGASAWPSGRTLLQAQELVCTEVLKLTYVWTVQETTRSLVWLELRNEKERGEVEVRQEGGAECRRRSRPLQGHWAFSERDEKPWKVLNRRAIASD